MLRRFILIQSIREVYLNNLKKYLIYIIILTFSIMSIVDYFGVFKFNSALSDTFIIMLFTIYIISYKKIYIKQHLPYLWYFATLILVAILSILVASKSILIQSSFLFNYLSEIIKLIIIPIYFYIGYNSFKNKTQFKSIINFWFIGLWFNIIVGLFTQISFFLGNEIKWHNVLGNDSRFHGGISDPNLAGTYLTLSLFIAIIYIKSSVERKQKSLGMTTLGLTTLCIFLTQSRGTLAGFGVAITIYLLINIKKSYKLLIMVLPLGFAIYFGFVDIDYTLFNSSLSQSITKRIETAAQGEGQFKIRKNLSTAALLMGIDHPIIGVGRGNFILNSKKYVDKVYEIRDDIIYQQSTSNIPHNTFIGIFAEMGILGLGVFLSLFILLLIKLIKNKNKINSIFIFALIAFFIQSLVLSLENFRGLWLAMGIMFKAQDVKVEASEDEFKISFDKLSIAYIAITFVLSFGVFFDVARKTYSPIKLPKNGYTTVINNLPSNKSNTLKYYLKSSGGNIYSSKIDVYIVSDNEDKIIYSKEYKKADGFGEIDLNSDNEASSYKIGWSLGAGENTKASIYDLYYEIDGKKLPILKYKYLPDGVRDFLASKNLLWFRQGKKTKGKEQNIEFYSKISNSIETKDIKVINKNGNENIKLSFKALKALDKNYVIRLNVHTDNINNAPYISGGFNDFVIRKRINPATSKWEVGKAYEFTFPFKGEDTEYYVRGEIEGIDNSNFEIGCLHPNSFSISDYISNIDKSKIVIISIKDEGTNAIDPETLRQLQTLGLKEELRNKTRYSYIAVGSKIDRFKPIEVLKKEKIDLELFKGEKIGEVEIPFNLEVISAGYETGNISSIKIDGKEHSKNTRGMNIVVYDMEKQEVIDSVNFDTYDSVYR